MSEIEAKPLSSYGWGSDIINHKFIMPNHYSSIDLVLSDKSYNLVIL